MQRHFGKFLLYAITVIFILLIAVITLTIGWRPFIGPKARPLTTRKFEVTPQRLERGKYLFISLAGCSGCHSPHDWKARGAPIDEAKLGSGEVMPLDGLPGTIVAPNLTPDPETGSGDWTDDQIARAIREGIGHDGRTLFPMMPYDHFRKMSDEDLASIVVYIRSLPAVHNPLPKSAIIFPVKYLIRSVPEPVTAPVAGPDPNNPLAVGAYLVNMADCAFCHTATDSHGQPLPGHNFDGGQVFSGPFGKVASANITPDATGISYYDEALFLQAMKTGYVKARPLNQLMPYGEFKNATDSDLKAIFAYLHTLKPLKHYVDNSEPPTYCKICRQMHGGGDRN
jgi:mono/diheme cytochrome c family protein